MKYLKQAGSKKGTLVFVHGNSSSAYIFQNILNSLKLDYVKIAVQLAGHEIDDISHDFKMFSTKNYTNELSNFINSIDDDIFLIGNSLGGHIAIESSKYIDRLKGLMIFGTPPVKKPINFEDAFLVVPALQTFLTENPTDLEIKNATEVAVYDKRHANSIATDFKAANPLVRKSLATDLTNSLWSDQSCLFKNLTIPKFIIKGEHDPTVNPEYLDQITQENEDCELISIPKCGHYPSLEQPEKLIKILQNASLKVFKK